jgi:hypothetical protein
MNGKFSKLAFLLIPLGLIPIVWWKPGYIIAKGDHFPLWHDPELTLFSDLHLWSSHNIGNPSLRGAFMLHEALWLLLTTLGLTVGFIQILFQVFFFMGSGLSMYYLSKTVYPKLRMAPIISGTFYMFNFFVLLSRLNLGFTWAYTFIPLLMILLIRILDTKLPNRKTPSKHITCFSIILTITFSLANANIVNIALILFALAIILVYYLAIQKRQIRPLLLNLTKIALLSILLNLWWAIPVQNYYLWSFTKLNPTVRVSAWRWTHARSSFLNLFWFNGVWGWRPEYYPYYDSYSNPILIVSTFVPFVLAASALLFKTKKTRFNTYLMLATLAFIFLAKGLHEPFSQLNLLLYNHIPYMTMFREPTSKFAMILMPFLALLIGYAVDRIANTKMGKFRPTNTAKIIITTIIIITFMIVAYPLVTNPIEAKTEQLPFSSYIKIPDYWHETTNWLNSQLGDYRILITPPDDFYQMPYTWGYYGTDQFLERLIVKPTISNHYAYSYKINPDITETLQHIQHTIKYNKTAEFQAFLDLLSIKYILQRNDIQYNFTGRNIIPPEHMQAFLTQQPYIHLDKKFGQLDVYEYTEHKPYIYALNPTTFKQITIEIENITTLEHSWNFAFLKDVQEWQNATKPDQWQINYTIIQDEHTLKAELWNSTWGWKLINSPLFPAQYGDTYQIQADIKGQNAHQAHIKMAEYDANKNLFSANHLKFVNDGTFNWTHATFEFEPTDKITKYLQMQVWHGHESDKPFPNIIWIDDVKIHGHTTHLKTTGLNLIFPNTTQNQPATILNYQKINPTKITATINATQPFILAISEALDQSWKAYVNGKQIENTPLYLGLKGFHINQTGLLKVVIEYEPQKWFYYGSIISIATLLACLIYLTCSWTKNKAFWKRIETILRAR